MRQINLRLFSFLRFFQHWFFGTQFLVFQANILSISLITLLAIKKDRNGVEHYS